jgi:urease accessory protein
MRTVRRLHDDPAAPTAGRLVLDYDARKKSRFRAHLEDGREIAVRLPRGTVLVNGDRLLADDGETYAVVAADEDLSVATTDDSLLFARAAYHLGNRHVPLEVAPGRLAYQHDHVLDELVHRLGLNVAFARAPFAPEGGAYGGGHHHHHEHDHASHHHHDHEHEHADHHHHEHAHSDGRTGRRA